MTKTFAIEGRIKKKLRKEPNSRKLLKYNESTGEANGLIEF